VINVSGDSESQESEAVGQDGPRELDIIKRSKMVEHVTMCCQHLTRHLSASGRMRNPVHVHPYAGKSIEQRNQPMSETCLNEVNLGIAPG